MTDDSMPVSRSHVVVVVCPLIYFVLFIIIIMICLLLIILSKLSYMCAENKQRDARKIFKCEIFFKKTTTTTKNALK